MERIGTAILALAFALAVLALVKTRRAAARKLEELSQAGAEGASRVAAADRDRAVRDAVLSSLEEGVVLFAADGSALYENERARHLLGGSVTSKLELAPDLFRDVAHGATEAVSSLSGRMLNGTSIPLPEGRTLLVIRDVTEARRIDSVRRDFVANASHELKTPAASIQALAETLVGAASQDPGEVPRFARQLESEALRLSRVVSDLLDLSRLEGDEGERAEVRLDELVSEEAERFRGRATGAGLTMSIAVEPASMAGSARDLGLLVRNLVENAIHYTRAGGTVEVSLRKEGGQVVLGVRDTGIGIPGRDRGRIFERFYRVDRARSRETGGTGLGLSIVKHVAENHGGTVSVESALGDGSTFTVRLPAMTET